MEDSLNNLHQAYLDFMRLRDVQSTQKLFNNYQAHTGHSMGSWSCGGCIRRTKEKTEMILSGSGLIETPRKFINKRG